MKRNHQKIVATPLGAVLCAFALFLVYVSAWAGGKADPSPCRITHPSDALYEWTCRRLPAGKKLDDLFVDRWRDVARFNRVDRRHAYPGVSLKVPARLDDIRDYSPLPRYYQPAEQEAKFILVDLSAQFLGAYEYGQLVF